jgi:hypothetical protein
MPLRRDTILFRFIARLTSTGALPPVSNLSADPAPNSRKCVQRPVVIFRSFVIRSIVVLRNNSLVSVILSTNHLAHNVFYAWLTV